MRHVLSPRCRTVPGRASEMVVAALAGDPASWLPPPARWHGDGSFLVDLRAGPLRHTVRCRVGSSWRVGAQLWRALSWVPFADEDEALTVERLLPTIRGSIGVRPSAGAAELTLQGSYEAPLHLLGSRADALVLHHLAEANVNAFLAAVQERVSGSSTTEDTAVGGSRKTGEPA